MNEAYEVDHLFLLIGANPLPNYVAAKLLWRNTESNAKIYFVYSTNTDMARDALQKALGFKDEDPHFQNVKVEEANPDNIYNTIVAAAQNIRGKVGLNYTGGTKAMAVHAYLALKGLSNLKVQYSYLDAQTLRMVVRGADVEKVKDPIVGLEIKPTIDTILALHGYSKPSLKRDLIWPDVANALAAVHNASDIQEIWQSWVRRSFFREPDWPVGIGGSIIERDDFWKGWARSTLLYHRPQSHKQKYDPRKWKSKTEVKGTPANLPTEPAEIDNVNTLIGNAVGHRSYTLEDVRLSIRIKEADDVGKWFEGEWLETYVLDQVQQLKVDNSVNQCHIGDAVRDIQADRNIKLHSDGEDIALKQEIQLDVAFLRGYQLFVLSCTTDLDKRLCKSKLLEASVRAEQIGGAEARVGLVCCFEDPNELEKELADVLGRRVKVFCRSDLKDLKKHIADWIKRVSP